MKNAEPTLDHGGLMGTTDMAPGKKKRKQKKLRRLPLNISRSTRDALRSKNNAS